MRSTRRMKFPSEQATGLQRGDTQSQTAKNTKISCALPQKIGPRMLNVMVLACILSRLSYPYASQQVLLLIHVDTMINDRESEMLLCFVYDYSWIDSVEQSFFLSLLAFRRG